MMGRYTGIFILVWVSILFTQNVKAQEIHIKDSIRTYNNKRIRINYIGDIALGAWGMTNMVYGGVGSATHNFTDAYPYQVATAFGVLNTGISVIRYAGLIRQLKHRDSYNATMSYYKSDRNFFIGSLVADIAITGGGLALLGSAKSGSADFFQNPGTARAVCIQGLFRLVFDNAMWAAHYHNNSRWYQIVSDMQFIGTGVSFRYSIGGRSKVGF